METYIHATAEVSPKADIGPGCKIWNHAQVRESAVLGSCCNVGKNAYIDSGVRIGDNVKIQNNVSIYDVDVGDSVQLGPGVIVTNDMYPRAFLWDEARRVRTVIKEGASVGANATVIGGSTIGRYALVGAGSVVTKDVPDHALVYGNPARIEGFVCFCGTKLGGHSLHVGNDLEFTCPDCGRKTRIPEKLWKSVSEE